jgi:integrase
MVRTRRTQNMLSKPTDKKLITGTDARDLPAPDRGSWIFYDADPKKRVAGFGLRITSAGARAFVLNYRAAGTERRLTIGAYPTWTLVRARARAMELRQAIDAGRDPLAEKVAEREAPTVRELARKAVEDHFSKKRASTRYDVYGDRLDEQGYPAGGQMAKWIIPTLGSLKVADVRPADIEALHGKVTKAGSPIRANRCFSTLSKMMSLAVRWGYRTTNPCKNAIDRNAEIKRDRYLTPTELLRLFETLAALPSQSAANAIRLLLLTGARRGETLKARWDQFNLETGTWTKPSSATKQDKLHHIPLNAPALQLLTDMQAKARGPYLFPGRDGKGHLVEIKTSWNNIRRNVKFDEPTRMHDLRHTLASFLVSSGSTLPMIGALLGQTSPTTTARYAHLFLDPLRAATESAGAVITGGKSADVVLLGEARDPAKPA